MKFVALLLVVPLAAASYDQDIFSLFRNEKLITALESGKRPGFVRSQLAPRAQPSGFWSTTVSGFSAWELCATIFGSGIDEDVALAEDLGTLPLLFIDEYNVDHDDQSATVIASAGLRDTKASVSADDGTANDWRLWLEVLVYGKRHRVKTQHYT